MSILSTLSVIVLSNSMALNRLLAEKETMKAIRDANKWELWCYAASFQREPTRPDHIFNMRWQKFRETEGYDLLRSLRIVGEEYLQTVNGLLYLNDRTEEKRRERQIFGRWQNIRNRMSTLPIKLAYLHSRKLPPTAELTHPQSPIMEDFIHRESLNEIHLHLHACMLPEECWLVDLYDMSAFFQEENERFRKDIELRELYASINPWLTPVVLISRMKLARHLRATILSIVRDPKVDHRPEIKYAADLMRQYSHTPIIYCPQAQRTEAPVLGTYRERMQEEISMWYSAFNLLDSEFEHKNALKSMLHLYLLIENEYIQLNRHNENAHGFNAFEKRSAHNRIAIGTSQYYETTFDRLLKASQANRETCIEVRLPASTLMEKRDMIAGAWAKSCRKYFHRLSGNANTFHPPIPSRKLALNNKNNPTLILTIHLIKRRLTRPLKNSTFIVSDLYGDEREKACKETAQLAQYLMWLSNQESVSLGIDAAGNELMVPPEVYAPAFRLFQRRTNIDYKTYHCGEDFRHLVSGIRVVYEAILFLDMKTGNRLGHATAVGIPPELWLQSMPGNLMLKKREWLMDLLFAWKLLRGIGGAEAKQIESEAIRTAKLIFPDGMGSDISIHTLEDLFDSRSLSPAAVRNYRHPVSLSQDAEEEKALVRDFVDKRGHEWIALFEIWHRNSEARLKQEEIMEVPRQFFSAEALLHLQQQVQQLIRERDIVIETLPVSNLRISQYNDIRQHHILRWLDIEGYRPEGDVDMNIAMGSDDPGIFVTDIKNEYYHLYNLLRESGLTTDEAIGRLRAINNAGRIYAFKAKRNKVPLQERAHYFSSESA